MIIMLYITVRGSLSSDARTLLRNLLILYCNIRSECVIESAVSEAHPESDLYSE